MKTLKLKSKLLNLFILTVASLIFGSTSSAFANEVCIKTADNNGIQSQILYAGQYIDTGTVSTQISGENLLITFETSGDWQLVETHLWVGENISDMPQTRKGNPKIGNFPYASGDITGNTFHVFTIPLESLNYLCPDNDKNFFVAAHAALQKVDGSGNVIQTETGWADGDKFVEKGSWSTFFSFTLSCDCDGPVKETSYETAFAEGQLCFLDIDEDNDGSGDFNRWGWSIGPIGVGSYSYDIYAGAGQCDTNKGTLVGTLNVIYDGFTAEIKYTMNTGFSMEEVHLYVGPEVLPSNVNGEYTVAPGQYPYINDELDEQLSYTFIVDELFGDLHIVAHAVVGGEY